MDKSSLQTMYIKPSQRLQHRLTAPLVVKIGNRAYRTADWSLSSVKIKDKGECKDLPMTEALLSIPFQGMELRMPIALQFQRYSEAENCSVFSFVDMSERQRDTLRLFIEELVRGEMVSSQDIIKRLDAPTTPVRPLDKQTPIPLPAAPKSARWQTWFFSLFYLVAGVGLTAWLGVLWYANVVKMEVQTAWLSTPTQALGSIVEGRVANVLVAEGSNVSKGAILARVSDPNLERDIDAAQAGLTQQAQLQLEQTQRIANLKAQVAILSAQIPVTKGDLARKQELFDAGALARFDLDKAKLDLVQQTSNLQVAKTNLAQLEQLGREHPVNSVGDRTLKILLNQRKRLEITAPFDGKVVRILRTVGTAVRPGDAVVLLQSKQDPIVEAYVSQQQSLQLNIGDVGEVYLPGSNVRMKASIRQLEPVSQSDVTGGLVSDQRQTGVKISLKLQNPTQARSFINDKQPQVGTPVVVVFERRRSSWWWQRN